MTSKLSTRSDYRRALLQPLYTALRAGHITHFYFISPDRRMVLRMQSPQRHDDDINRLHETRQERDSYLDRAEKDNRGRDTHY